MTGGKLFGFLFVFCFVKNFYLLACGKSNIVQNYTYFANVYLQVKAF